MREKYLLLKNIQDALLENISSSFKREVYKNIDWDEEVIGLIGERGVGKTTIMLQRMKGKQDSFYFSADNPIISDIGLFQFVYFLHRECDIKTFYIDEVHRYPEWTQEIKSICDSLVEKKIIFSGSSSLDLFKGVLDLGRRAKFYDIYPLNFQEYLKMYQNEVIETYTLEDILENHQSISLQHGNVYKEKYFRDFIYKGQYPYAKNLSDISFVGRLQNLLDKIILEDIPIFLNMQTVSLDKIRKIFYFIAHSSPSELSFTFLSRKIGVDKSIVENVVVLLSKIGLIHLIPKFGNLSERVRKEYKIFLGNTNLYNAYNINTDIGILRESFFVSCIKKIPQSEVFLPKKGDFTLVVMDKQYHFEVGGKNKRASSYPINTYIIKDNIISSGEKNIIPLWIFGLLKAYT